MTPNGFFCVCQSGAPLSRALSEIKQLLCVQSLILYYIKQIDSMLPCICPVIDHRGRQNVVRTSVTHGYRLVCHFFVLTTSSVIYYWTDARQHGIYLLNRNTSGSLGELNKAVETRAADECSHCISRSPKLPLVFLTR